LTQGWTANLEILKVFPPFFKFMDEMCVSYYLLVG
jgi:hypothetical protein